MVMLSGTQTDTVSMPEALTAALNFTWVDYVMLLALTKNP